jgi:hypothetical protein
MAIVLPPDIANALANGTAFTETQSALIKQYVASKYPAVASMANVYLQKYNAGSVAQRKQYAAIIKPFVK